MKAVKDSRGVTTLISRDEASVFNKIAMQGTLSISSLSEREQYLADQMVHRNVLEPVKRHSNDCYKIYPQLNQV